MKKILGLLAVFLMISANCFAMNFSQPVEIGWIGISQARGTAGGFCFKNETSNSGDYYTVYEKNNKNSYGKGIARFGSGRDSLYVYYDAYKNNKHVTNIGGDNLKNTIQVNVLNSWIYKITSDRGIIIYAIREWYGTESDWTILGRLENGNFVKYIDTTKITEKYIGLKNGNVSPVEYKMIKSQEDTIIINYSGHDRKTGRKFDVGEFRFKWDESAQWFGVEHVVY